MRGTLIAVKLLVAVLVACAVPVQSPSQDAGPVKAPTASLPPPTPSSPEKASPAPTPSEKAKTAPTPTAELSDAPLESGVLLTRWGLRSGALHAVDPLTGRDLSGYAPIDMGHHFNHAFSPDGKTLAAVRYLGDSGRGGVLHLIDLQAWRDVTTALKFDNWITAMSFSPDGKRLVIAYAGRPTTAHGMPENHLLVTVDVVEQVAVAQTSFDFEPRVVKYTSDGASLMVYGVTYDTNTAPPLSPPPSGGDRGGVGPPHAVWLDAAGLSVEWDVALPDVRDGQFKQKESDGSETYFAWWPAVVPSHDGQALYIVHADEDRLTTVDFANRATRTVAIGPARSWLEQLLTLSAGVAYAKGSVDRITKQAVLSSDGKRLYIVGITSGTWQDASGERRPTQTPLGLQVVDATSGVEIAKLETQATEIDLSPDGSRLVLRGGSNIGLPWTEVVDAARLETVARLGGRTVIPAQRIGGQPILLASYAYDDTALATLDAQSLKTIHAWWVDGGASWLSVPYETFTKPSAQPAAAPTFASSVLLAQWGTNGRSPKILPVDPATGREVPGYAPILAWPEVLSADGKKLAAIESHGQATESYAGGTSYRPSADVLHLVDVTAWRAVTATLPGKGWVSPITFSPDARRLALAYHNRTSSTLLLFDADTGQILAQQALAFRPTLMAFTPDGTSLVAYGQPLGSPPGMGKPDSPRVLLAEATTLEVMWDQPLEDILSGDWCLEKCSEPHGAQVFAEWRPAVVLSHDGRKLYIVHADEERLTTVDLNARTIQSVEVQVARSWFERLLALTAGVAEAKGVNTGTTKEAVLSPDGKHLYVVETTRNITRSAEGNSEGIETQVGLQVIDVESGHKAASRNIEVTGTWISADRIRFTPDGAYLVVSGWRDGEQWTEVLDAKSLERAARLDGWEISITRGMNGRPIILASQYDRDRTEFAVLDPRSFDIIYSWSANRYASWVAAP